MVQRYSATCSEAPHSGKASPTCLESSCVPVGHSATGSEAPRSERPSPHAAKLVAPLLDTVPQALASTGAARNSCKIFATACHPPPACDRFAVVCALDAPVRHSATCSEDLRSERLLPHAAHAVASLSDTLPHALKFFAQQRRPTFCQGYGSLALTTLYMF